jgi:glycosyltransferase involved in cell wall biosynthesis
MTRTNPAARRPRVLQLILSLNPGGTERLLVEIVTRLQPAIPMTVCCLDGPGDWAAEIEAVGVPVEALARSPGFRPALGARVASIARRHAATVIHAHQYSPFVYGCLSRAWRPSSQVIYTEHGRASDAPPSARRRTANRVLARLPRNVYAVSEDLKRHMVNEGFAAEDVQVIYNGINVGRVPDSEARAEARRKLGVADDTIVIGTIARLDPVKDLHTAIKGLGAVRQKTDIAFVVVGDGPERALLERTAAAQDAAAWIRWLGHRDDARQWLAGCDVFVNTSISEGISLTILEAMAAGLPVVATRVGGTPEIIDGSCGRLVPARDPAGLASALLELAGSSTLRRALGAAGRARVERQFTIEKMVHAYQHIYMRAS